MLAVVLFTVGAAKPEGCMGASPSETLRARSQAVKVGTGGRFFISGQAPDFHAPEEAGAGQQLTKALAYVREGRALPFLWVESRIAAPQGHRSGKVGLGAIGLVEGQDYVHLDAAQLKAQPGAWWSTLSTRYSAIVVASDVGGLLTQEELDQLNSHRGALTRFMRDGGGLVAFSQGGVGLTRRDHFEFLPFLVLPGASTPAAPPFAVTAFGQEALGLEDGDVGSPAYSRFDGTSGFAPAVVNEATGEVLAVAGQVELGNEFVWAHAGADATYYGKNRLIPVTLDGSGSSTDEEAEPLRYIWMIGDGVLMDTEQAVSEATLPAGTYDVQLVLINARGEVAMDEVVITTVRTSEPPPPPPPSGPPSIECPASVAVPTAAGTCGAQVYFPAPSVSAPNGVASVACTHLTGSVFAGGATQVSCTVVDQKGLSASCGFTVTVRDQEAPSLVPPAPTVSEADASCQGTAPGTEGSGARASDNCTAPEAIVITRRPLSGTRMGVGTHVIEFTATDAAGNSTTAATTHTVVDATPPLISRTTPSQRTLWPPNHKLVEVGVEVDATDNCGGSEGGPGGDAVQCHVFRVTSNEPINGRGDGNTDWDWEITGPRSVKLRAERAGPASSRIYMVWVACTDSSGHVTTDSTAVTVPHDQGKK
jgi:PKD repeat protein